jgi:hypothetical protein
MVSVVDSCHQDIDGKISYLYDRVERVELPYQLPVCSVVQPTRCAEDGAPELS